MVRPNRGQEEGQGSRRQAPKRGRTAAAAAPRRNPNTLPYNHFWNPEGHASFYEDDNTAGNERTLCPALAIKFDFLNKHHFDSITRMLEYQGWGSFLEISTPYDASMIRQFYHNLIARNHEDDSTTYMSKVNGQIVEITSLKFASHFTNVDRIIGAKIDGTNFNQFCVNYDSIQARKSLLDLNCANDNSQLISDFSIENRLLFHILTKVIVPRSGSFTKATDWDVGLMYFIRNHIKINLGSLLITHMLSIAHVKNRACAYLMPLTHFFVNHCHIPTFPTNTTLPKQVWYDESMLKKLFVLDENTGLWGRKFHSQNLVAPPENAPQDPNQEGMNMDFDPQNQFDPNLQSQNYPNFSYDIPGSSSNPPSQASYDPFLSQYNPTTYQSDMFNMMQRMNMRNVAFEDSARTSFEQMNNRNLAFEESTRSTLEQLNTRQAAFEGSTRTSFDRLNARLNTQEQSITEINDSLKKIFNSSSYF